MIASLLVIHFYLYLKYGNHSYNYFPYMAFDNDNIILVQQLDPNAEVMHWLEVAHLKNTYYQPFVVPSDLLPGYVHITVI